MNLFQEFISSYGATILYTVFTALAGYLGIAVKNLYQKYINDKTKKEVVQTCVQAVEQLYTDLHGEDKYNKVVESVSEMLGEKGVSITDIELKMLIESAVGKFNQAFQTSNQES
jgi:lipoate-protein ligase A